MVVVAVVPPPEVVVVVVVADIGESGSGGGCQLLQYTVYGTEHSRTRVRYIPPRYRIRL